MINLPSVTLLAVSSIRISETIMALLYCCEGINFNSVKLISHEIPKTLPSNIKFEQCRKINNILDYNQIVFKELYPYVKTSHCLLIQYDGWVIHPELWDDSWLDYDFCGAPWPIVEGHYLTLTGERIRVGNGGISLRSRNLLELPEKYHLSLVQDRGYYNEDGNICVYWRKEFLEHGIKYAPVEVAARFSYENSVPENIGLKTFAFHKHITKENL